MEPLFTEFKRTWAASLYKNLKIPMGNMTFCKDFVHTDRGDLYPVWQKSADCDERVEHNRYVVEHGAVTRLFCRFFPFATYEFTARAGEGGAAGLVFRLPHTETALTVSGDTVICRTAAGCAEQPVPAFVKEAYTMVVSCRPGAFDVYFVSGGMPVYNGTFCDPAFEQSNTAAVFENGYVALYAAGAVSVSAVESYVDNGVSLADIRPIKHENGDVMSEQGRVYFTASVRMQEHAFQGVFSWVPGTADFQMTGAMFYDRGDGVWHNYLAPVLLYHRPSRQWYVWVSSFDDAHILAHGAFEGDPRFGVNVVDVQLMSPAAADDGFTAFAGFKGDEDPDLVYNGDTGRWQMAICRLDPQSRTYRYVFFESERPFDGYTCCGTARPGEETGGSFVQVGDKRYFVCGNSTKIKSEYRIYSREGMRTAAFNYPDGGFRGWGTVFPVKMGSRTRLFWLTFDRHGGSDYTWSYGNLYAFEAGETSQT